MGGFFFFFSRQREQWEPLKVFIIDSLLNRTAMGFYLPLFLYGGKVGLLLYNTAVSQIAKQKNAAENC
jgi:hypothetical protein